MTSNTQVFGEDEVVAVVIMMICVVFVGGIGNILVIIVECIKKIPPGSKLGRRRRRNRRNQSGTMEDFVPSSDKTLDFFILVLAISDLVVCLVIIPATIQMELNQFRMEIDFLCKLFYVLFVANTTFSSLLISVVALDRYLYICHSLKRILTLFRAKMLVISLSLFAIFIGVMAGTAVSVKPTPPEINSTEIYPEPILVCEEVEFISNITVFQKTFSTIVKRVNHGCFFVCILIVTILYSLVFWAIVSARGRRHRLIVKKTCSNAPDSNGDVIPQIRTSRSSSTPANRMFSLSEKVVERAQCTFQNIRSALMLFVIALVYIVTFVPVLLMTNELLPQNLFLMYLYYVNSAANPCIYAAFSKSFRSGVADLIRDCFPRTDGLSLPTTARSVSSSVKMPPKRGICLGVKKSKKSQFVFITREERMARSNGNHLQAKGLNGNHIQSNFSSDHKTTNNGT